MKPIFNYKLMKTIKSREKEWYKKYLEDVARFDLSISNLTKYYEKLDEQKKELENKNATKEEWDEFYKYASMVKRNLFKYKSKRKYVRPSKWEDVIYRKRQESLFQRKVLEVIPENLLLRFHGSPIYFSEQIIKSKKIVPSQDTYGIKTSADEEGKISVTRASNLNRMTIPIYSFLFEWQESLPAGCVFAVFPLIESELDDSRWFMNKVDFREHPEQLYKIITTPENISLVKKWCRESGLSTSYVCDYNKFVKLLRKDVKNNIFGKKIGLFKNDDTKEQNSEDVLTDDTAKNLENTNSNTYLYTTNDEEKIEYLPTDLDKKTKEELERLKEHITENYSSDNSKGLSR